LPDEGKSFDYKHGYTDTPPTNLEELVFDIEFHRSYHDWDGGGYAVFRLLDGGPNIVYLVLYNHHNGYYGHGFEVKHGGITVEADGKFVRYEGGETIRNGGL
jgi:hypothetical protein